MAELKPGWQRVKFGDVVRQVKNKVDPNTSGLSRYVAGEHMDTDDLRIRRWGDIGDGYLGPAFHMHFKPGHVLYGSRRTYLRKVALADFEGICANTTFVLESADSSKLLPDLLPFIMRMEVFHEHSIRESKGSVNPYVNFSDLAWFEFALPPLGEQQKIAEILSVHASVREAYLHASLAAEEVARACARDYFSAFSGRYLLGTEIASLITKGESPKWQGLSYCEQGARFITSENILAGSINLNPSKHIPLEFHAKLMRSQIHAGDLLVNIGGASIGRAAVAPEGIGEANTNQAVAVIRPRKDIIDPRFLLEWFLSPFGQKIVAGQQVNTARANISLSDLRKMRIPCPDKLEQERLLGILEELRVSARTCRTREVFVQELSSVIS